MTRDFVTTDSVLAGHQQPHAHHPLVHAQRRVLEDTPNLDRELLLAALAEPQMTGTNVGVLF